MSRLDHYARVSTKPWSDGEQFRVTVDAGCSEDWRSSLRRSGLVCDEDWEGPTDGIGRTGRPSVYSCLDQRDPANLQVWVIFRDFAHVEFLWVKA